MKTILSLINTHLLAALTLAYIIGISGSAYFSVIPIFILTSAAVSALLLFLCCFRKIFTFSIITSLFLFFTIGFLQGTISSQTPQSTRHIFNMIEQPTDAVIIGRLISMPTFDTTTSQAEISVQSLRIGSSEQYKSTQGTVLLRLLGPWPHEYTPGSLLAIRTVLQRPSMNTVPGTFDYPAYLARKNIWITGFSRSQAQLQRIATQPSLTDTIHFYPEHMRTSIGTFLDHNIPPHLSGLYRAILLGDRSRIPNGMLDKFKASGTMHILAISGIHVTLITSLVFTVIYWLLRRSGWLILNFNLKKLTGILCLPLIVGYTLLAGSNTPVIRAGIMSAIVILAFCTDRPKTISSLLAFGALLILVHSPQALFTASFQLSFAAFASIVMLMPALQQILHPNTNAKGKAPQTPLIRIARWLAAAIFASLAATFGTAPLIIYFFHRLPLTGPIANLILEPLICLWALPLGFLALPFMFTFPALATFLLYCGSLGLQLAVSVASLFEAIPQATLWLATPDLILILCYYCSFIYSINTISNIRKNTSLLRITIPFSLCLILLLTPVSRLWSKTPLSTTISILDVGQGNATLIQTIDGKNILIDGGGPAHTEESVGQRIIAPFLWNAGITKLDTLILTHADADHYNGFPFLIEHFSPSRLWTNTTTDGNKHYKHMLLSAEKKGIEVLRAASGDTLHSGQTAIQCIANTSKETDNDSKRNTGLIIEVRTSNSRILFPGDIDSSSEKLLIEGNTIPKSDILLAAHHGSASSNSIGFLQHINPKAIVVSAGQSHNSLFPSEQLRDYCKQQQLPLLVTAETGTVKIQDRGDTTEISFLDNSSTNPLRREREEWIPAQFIKTAESNTEAATLP